MASWTPFTSTFNLTPLVVSDSKLNARTTVTSRSSSSSSNCSGNSKNCHSSFNDNSSNNNNNSNNNTCHNLCRGDSNTVADSGKGKPEFGASSRSITESQQAEGSNAVEGTASAARTGRRMIKEGGSSSRPAGREVKAGRDPSSPSGWTPLNSSFQLTHLFSATDRAGSPTCWQRDMSLLASSCASGGADQNRHKCRTSAVAGAGATVELRGSAPSTTDSRAGGDA